MRDTLAGVGARTPDDVFTQMRRHIEDGGGDLPEMVTWRFEAEDRFRDSLKAVRSAEDELARMKNVSANPFTEWASARVEDRKDSLIRAEGARVQARAADMEAQLVQMLADAEINKLDLMQMEQRLYEMSAAKGKAVEARETVSRKKRVKPDQRWWPWEGEYWQDEVGYYRSRPSPTAPWACRSAPAATESWLPSRRPHPSHAGGWGRFASPHQREARTQPMSPRRQSSTTRSTIQSGISCLRSGTGRASFASLAIRRRR